MIEGLLADCACPGDDFAVITHGTKDAKAVERTQVRDVDETAVIRLPFLCPDVNTGLYRVDLELIR